MTPPRPAGDGGEQTADSIDLRIGPCTECGLPRSACNGPDWCCDDCLHLGWLWQGYGPQCVDCGHAKVSHGPYCGAEGCCECLSFAARPASPPAGAEEEPMCECDHGRGCHDGMGNCWHLDEAGDEDCDCDQFRPPAGAETDEGLREALAAELARHDSAIRMDETGVFFVYGCTCGHERGRWTEREALARLRESWNEQRLHVAGELAAAVRRALDG